MQCYASIVILLLSASSTLASETATLNKLAASVFEWRGRVQPISSDDLPRVAVQRPSKWAPNVTQAAFDQQEVEYHQLVLQVEAVRESGSVPFSQWSHDDQADYWAITAVMARAYYELYIDRAHWRDPVFYVQQGPGAVWDLLVRSHNVSDWSLTAIADLQPRLCAIPGILEAGMVNLKASGEAVADYASVALEMLQQPDLGTAVVGSVAAIVDAAACSPDCDDLLKQLTGCAEESHAALDQYASWLKSNLPSMSTNSSLGEGALQWFLQHVSFVHMDTDAVIDLGRRELDDATSKLQLAKLRNDLAGLPASLPLFKSLEEQQNATTLAQMAVVQFLSNHKLITFPEWLPNPGYSVQAVPKWLSSFSYSQVGEEDDWNLQLNTGFTRYCPSPVEGLPLFLDILARDPRPLIVHEGIPGHWYQFTMSKHNNEREVRQHWIDSTANEGLAYYFEMMTLNSGMFDDKPRLHETLYKMQRLRAVRAQIDAGLAAGRMSVENASDILRHTLGLSEADARSEISARLQTPGQGLSYVVGKAQVLEYVRLVNNGPSFDFQAFHDDRVVNGNVPLALQMHAAGVRLLNSSFTNIHFAFPKNFNSSALQPVATDPTRVRGLPGAPAGVSPVMFSGYVPVTSDRHLYYWLVQAEETMSSVVAPLVLWLQGGNGCSSLTGLLSENGPFWSPNGVSLEPNAQSWHKLPAHVLYIDRPAGAGFSFSISKNYSQFANDNTTAFDTLALVKALLLKYPWLCGRPVFVAGESYAGHFVVQAASLLAAEPSLCAPLGGLMIGNGVVDLNQTNYAWFEMAFTHSLAAPSTWSGLTQNCHFQWDMGVDGNGCPSNQTKACQHYLQAWMADTGSSQGLLSLYDYYTDVCLNSKAPFADSISAPCIDATTTRYLQQLAVRSALHIDSRAAAWADCSDELNDAYSCSDTWVSVVHLYRDLLKSQKRPQRLLIYSGDVDGVVPTAATRRWVQAMESLLVTRSWQPWLDGQAQLGGVTFSATLDDPNANGNLTFATIRGAGHMCPRYQGQRTYFLMQRFLFSSL